jgi:hypothetical protein
MVEEEQPKRILSWMALNLLERQQKWRLKVAKHKGEDTTELEKRVNAIREAKDKV